MPNIPSVSFKDERHDSSPFCFHKGQPQLHEPLAAPQVMLQEVAGKDPGKRGNVLWNQGNCSFYCVSLNRHTFGNATYNRIQKVIPFLRESNWSTSSVYFNFFFGKNIFWKYYNWVMIAEYIFRGTEKKQAFSSSTGCFPTWTFLPTQIFIHQILIYCWKPSSNFMSQKAFPDTLSCVSNYALSSPGLYVYNIYGIYMLCIYV